MSDHSLPMPGGPLPSRDVVVPYHGGKVTLEPEAQQMSKASAEFTSAFPDRIAQAGRKHNRLDPQTQANLDELMMQMRRDRPKPATVVNLHPFELQFNAENYLLRGHVIPACFPGMPFAHKTIRGWRHDGGSYNEDGSRKFKPITPIMVAGEFMREFSKIETFGPGVLIYLGDANPDKAGQVETYDTMGRLITVDKDGFDFDEEDRKIPIVYKDPVTASFPQMLKNLRTARNAFYLQQVRKAERWVKKGEKFAPFSQDYHIAMAQVLVADGLIPSVPEELTGLATREQRAIAENNCPSCQHAVKKGAYKCEHCANILDALAAFIDGAIEFEHAKMSLLSDEQFAEAEKVHKQRQKRLGKRQSKPEKD